MDIKTSHIWIYSNLAKAAQNFARNFKINLIFISLLKLLPIIFASIWYNDEKTPNYFGLNIGLFWYSFLNQFIRYWKINHHVSLNEKYYEYFLEVLTKLCLARFISETLQIHYILETMAIIVTALVVSIFQFFLKDEFKRKNQLLRFIECQWTLFIQIIIFLQYTCVQVGILFPFTTSVVDFLLLIHFFWFFNLVYEVYVNMKSFWHIKEKRRQYQKAILVILSLIYVPLTLYFLQTHLHSGVGSRLYMQAISGLIAAHYLSKKSIEKSNSEIKLKSISLIMLGYIVVVVYYLIYFFYQKKVSGQSQNNHFFRILTKIFVCSIAYTFWEFYSTGKKLLKLQLNNKNESHISFA